MLKKLGTLFMTLLNFHLAAGTTPYLIDIEKNVCLENVMKIDQQGLWDIFLRGQTNYFFKTDLFVIESAPWWQQAQSVLEIGSGNGAYLHKLSLQSKNKNFLGIEKNHSFVELAKQQYAQTDLSFVEGDAEVINPPLQQTADLVLFRFVLQHLQQPLIALEHTWQYLLPDGHVLVMDACDDAIQTSHPVNAYIQACAALKKMGLEKGKINRDITLQLMSELEKSDSTLSQLYEVVFSNLDKNGNALVNFPYDTAETERKTFADQILLFLTLVNRVYHIPVDLSAAYDELKAYTKDENAWTTIGLHYLVLKKKS